MLRPTGPTEVARVVHVNDGDTIRVLIDGQEHALRYIGIDAPETGGPFVPLEPLGREATVANAELVDGRSVVLERDVSDRDRFDRLLRHVWLERSNGWLLVSAELVRQGYASASTFPPDVKHTDVLRAAEREARAAGRGLWSGEGGPTADVRPPRNLLGEQCDAAYPDVCIAPPPPDLDCGDVEARRFAVRPPDPHRFDGDGDGLGCEGS